MSAQNLHEAAQEILMLLEELLSRFFCENEIEKNLVHSCVAEAATLEGRMLMTFKEKMTSSRRAVIYLRYLDSCEYFPLLRVFDQEGNILLEKDLPRTRDFNRYGNIQLSRKKVSIHPRKNSCTVGKKPMTFEY